jgi:hypothetical protein
MTLLFSDIYQICKVLLKMLFGVYLNTLALGPQLGLLIAYAFGVSTHAYTLL